VRVNDKVKTIHINQDLEDKNFKKKRVIHWVSSLEKYHTKFTILEYDHLITSEKVEDGVNIEDVVNRNSKFDTPSFGDISLRTLKKSEYIQLERRGYFICDNPWDETSQNLVLIFTPDGRSTSMSGIKTHV